MVIIEPIFTTKLAKDALNADGSVWMPKGSSVAYMTGFTSTKFGNFSILAPNPVHLLIESVDSLIKEADLVAKEINSSNKIFVFSKLVDGVNKYTTDELLKLDPNATQSRNLDQEKVYKYLYLSANILISLISSVEAFVNQEIPPDYEEDSVDKKGNKTKLKKADIERGKRLEEKIQILGQIYNVEKYKSQRFWQDFKKIKKIRDDFVHLKTKGSIMVNRNDQLYRDLIDFDLKICKSSIVSLINFFINDYIKEKDIKSKNI